MCVRSRVTLERQGLLKTCLSKPRTRAIPPRCEEALVWLPFRDSASRVVSKALKHRKDKRQYVVQKLQYFSKRSPCQVEEREGKDTD